jgi:hypothetical protein
VPDVRVTEDRSAMEGRKPWRCSFVIPSPKRVEVIESEADMARSPEDVFDYCSDPRTSLNGTF